MKIDASRYTMFWQNPERYRLREIWKLAPVEPKAGTFASLLSYGRRRGTCFHELRDAAYRGVPEGEAVQSLKDGGFGDREIEAAKRMVTAVADRYPDETYSAHEVCFEHPISLEGSTHVLTGRMDHILPRDGELLVGDWKTSKYRAKKDRAFFGAKYAASPQVGFYILGARSLGFDCSRFLYRVVYDRKNGSPAGVQVEEYFAQRSGLELKQLERSVHITCELIEYLKQTFGMENPWPVLWEPFDRGYSSMLGRKMYEGYMPEGFTEKIEHLSTMMDDEDEETDEGN